MVCLKWGTPYPAEYVNVLHRAVAEHMSYPHRFVCITDTPEGLDSDIEIIPLPEIPIERQKWGTGFWPKLAVFKSELFPPDEIVLYLDVDILIAQSLDPFIDLIDSQKGLHIIREWNPDVWQLVPLWSRPDRGGNGSAIGFIAKEQTHLFADFSKAPYEIDRTFRLDQVYITEQAFGRRYWPDRWCRSFRRDCVFHWPLNFVFRSIRKPRQGKIIVFHGIPNPMDVIEPGNYRWGTRWRYSDGPVEWVQEYWQKHSRRS